MKTNQKIEGHFRVRQLILDISNHWGEERGVRLLEVFLKTILVWEVE